MEDFESSLSDEVKEEFRRIQDENETAFRLDYLSVKREKIIEEMQDLQVRLNDLESELESIEEEYRKITLIF